MPQPSELTESLGTLQITATERGYKIVDAEKNTKAEVQEPFSICAVTNMQRAMLRAQQIMEEEEEAKAASDALQSGDRLHTWDDAKKSLDI